MKWHIACILLIAAIIGCLMVGLTPSREKPLALTASAHAVRYCMPVEVITHRLDELGWRYIRLKGEALVIAAAVFNALPPEGDRYINIAVLLEHPNGDGALLVGFGGMICGGEAVHREEWFGFKRTIIGIDA